LASDIYTFRMNMYIRGQKLYECLSVHEFQLKILERHESCARWLPQILTVGGQEGHFISSISHCLKACSKLLENVKFVCLMSSPFTVSHTCQQIPNGTKKNNLCLTFTLSAGWPETFFCDTGEHRGQQPPVTDDELKSSI
jgi:hypothetical protein